MLARPIRRLACELRVEHGDGIRRDGAQETHERTHVSVTQVEAHVNAEALVRSHRGKGAIRCGTFRTSETLRYQGAQHGAAQGSALGAPDGLDGHELERGEQRARLKRRGRRVAECVVGGEAYDQVGMRCGLAEAFGEKLGDGELRAAGTARYGAVVTPQR